MTQFNRCAVLVSVLLTSFACGGEEDDKGGGGSAKVESGLDGSKPVNTLTQADVEKLGQSYASSASASEVVNAICQFQGVIFSGLGGALGGAGGGAAMQEGPSCQEMVDMCKMNASSAPATVTQNTAAIPTTTAGFAMCDVTVGELEACLSASLKAITTVFGSVSCGQSIEDIDASAVSTAQLTECQNLSTKCPTVIVDSQTGGDEEF